MSSTNKTTNYNLSQFVGTDVPSYLGDYNSDMSKIDKAIGDVANSQGSVEQSVVGLTAEMQGLSTQVSGVSTNVQQLQTSVAQIDSAYKQADTDLSQRITANANNIQTNTTSISGINSAIGSEDISDIGDGTIKGGIKNINDSLEALKNVYGREREDYSSYCTTSYAPFSCPKTGWYYMYASTGTDDTKPVFLRFGNVNGYFCVMSGSQGRLRYITSPLIYIKKGEQMIAQHESGHESFLYYMGE